MIDGKEWDDLNETTKSLLFKYGFLLSDSWKRKAARLKYAADCLYEIHNQARTRFLERCAEGFGPTSSLCTITDAELKKEVASISLITEYCLLMGYAIENLLKGILMSKHPEYFNPGTKITHIRSHNLVNFCNRGFIPITDEEKELLKKLTEYIEWVGKYPVPLEISGMYPKKKIDGSWDGKGINELNGKLTKDMVESLYNRFWDELNLREREEET